MRGSRKFCQKMSNFDNVFFRVFVCFVLLWFVNLVDEEREDLNTTISVRSSGPPAKRHINGVSLECR